ncbi:Glutathione S-transferase GST-6.0 [Roseovarius sp. EC-HK134]|jgi:glutathione S-transferase|uniref:Glutathione S-transferase GST-6.0 n=1 Tax=Roseovarius mucosus TaxID=215743 RepID=A0A1V0RS37_9RHOB|nr:MULTISPECIES: glutathione S-transferase family protein [Roseovarius]MBS4011223.1 glutathione S-transferase family protein [Roseovarius sp.]ARE84587.1 glutathione S-transferase GST-6.0 [Roseovarius mucosus]MBW4973872.1 glutathione S-transferase family protein [Roseovarius mucosus]VVT19837.1 Glutathione S-transferase GST-6.0 [Roseovarius sp. EC-SD190]VVT19968.1 Glutathione S-transferase GST-6.0 [Roseovarius sp. EC-HK134]
MYDVIGSRASRAFRVLWLLEEMGVGYNHMAVAPRSPEALAANPSGKIPALRDGDAVLTDSAAIMTYLADKHGQFTHAPGTVARARQDALTHQILDEIDGTLWTAARHSFVLPEEHRVPAVKDSLKWEYERNLARLSDALTGPFLQGETMTIADILLVHCLMWAGKAGFADPDDKLKDYMAMMVERPACQRAAALP